ncbi:MAG: hypothetical protein WC421_03515 [Elusimicrobiales bacterium]
MNDYTVNALIRTVYDDRGINSFRQDLAAASQGAGELARAAGAAYAAPARTPARAAQASASLTGPDADDFADIIREEQEYLLSASEAAKLWGDTLESTARGATKKAAGYVHDFFNSAGGDFLNLEKLGEGVFKSIEDAFFSTLEKMAAKAAVYGALDLLTGGGFGSMFGGFGKFLSFDAGGPVPGPAGAPVPALVHGGEYVLNREQAAAMSGGAGGQINVTVNAPVTISGGAASSAQDARAIAETIADAARRGVAWAVESAKVGYKVGLARSGEGAL